MPEPARARWTPTRIRKATLLPKPRGAIAKALNHLYATDPRQASACPMERRMLDYIAEHADLIDLALPTQLEEELDEPIGARARWLLLPSPAWLLDALATHGAEREDHEPDEDVEADADDEPDSDTEGRETDD